MVKILLMCERKEVELPAVLVYINVFKTPTRLSIITDFIFIVRETEDCTFAMFLNDHLQQCAQCRRC